MWTKEDQRKSDKEFRDRRRSRDNVIIPDNKICSKCLIEKSSSDFTKEKVAKDGLKPFCKPCTKIETDNWKAKNWFKKLIHSAKSTSKKYNLNFDLDEEFILDLFKNQGGKCFYLKINLEPAYNKRKLNSPSLDRINCDKGYTKDNVVLCSQFANLGRCDVPFDEFLIFCHKLLNVVSKDF